jgi:hypothetical protein
MVYVLGFLLGCCLGAGLYYLEKYRDKIYYFFKGTIEEKYGKTITMTINVCLWIMVWIIYFIGCALVGHILKPLL